MTSATLPTANNIDIAAMKLKHIESALSSVQREFPSPNVSTDGQFSFVLSDQRRS
jgi:hypothetical protein